MKDPSVVIVIGASQGIGRARAVRLAHDFSAVVLAARHEEELKETAAAVKSTGDEPLIFAVDLREPQSGEIIVKEISWCAPPDHPNLGRIEGLEWICRSDLRKRRSRSEAGLCCCKCRDHRSCKGIRRAGH